MLGARLALGPESPVPIRTTEVRNSYSLSSVIIQGKNQMGVLIPADVEIPAPVNTMKCLLFLICFARTSAFRSTTARDSRRSSAATFGAVSAILDL